MECGHKKRELGFETGDIRGREQEQEQEQEEQERKEAARMMVDFWKAQFCFENNITTNRFYINLRKV
jgi:replication fork clamp-binding protein CrfC